MSVYVVFMEKTKLADGWEKTRNDFLAGRVWHSLHVMHNAFYHSIPITKKIFNRISRLSVFGKSRMPSQ
jgi:hypothetical protein